MSKSKVKPYCPHCNRYINHKNECKKYTEEAEEKYNKKLEELEVAREAAEEEQKQLDEDLKQFSTQFPRVAKHYENELLKLNDTIEDMKWEIEKLKYPDNNSY